MEVDKKAQGSINQSILFTLDEAGLPITGMKLGYIRWTDGDGTTFAETINALTELATITTVHTDSAAKYLDIDATGGNQFVIRVDFPDAAFASGRDKIICNVYDDDNNVIAQRIFDLSIDLTQYPDGLVYYNPTAPTTGTVFGVNGTFNKPVNNKNDAVTLALGINKAIGVRGGKLFAVDDFSGLTLIGKDAEASLSLDSVSACAFTNITDINVAVSDQGFKGTLDTTVKFDNCSFDAEGFSSDAGNAEARNCNFVTSEINMVSKVTLIECNTLDNDILSLVLNSSPSEAVVKRHVGNLTIDEADTGNEHYVHMLSGNIVINANCNDGNLILTGKGNLVNNATGTFTVDLSGWEQVPSDIQAYPDGLVYFDPTAPTTGTVIGVNGKFNTPVNDQNDAVTLALGINKAIGIRGGEFPVVDDISGLTLIGKDAEATLSLDSNSACAFTKITDINVAIEDAGIKPDIASFPIFDNTTFDSEGISSTGGDVEVHNSRFITSRIDMGGKATLIGCTTLDKDILTLLLTRSTSFIDVKKHLGNLTIDEADTGNEHYVHMINGNIVINANCNSGNLILTGKGVLIDNSTGTFTIDTSGWTDLASKSTAYPDGKIYFEEGATTNIGTHYGTDGTMDNPVTLESAAVSLANALGTRHISVRGDFDMAVSDDLFRTVLEARIGAEAGDRVIASGTENDDLRFINLDIASSEDFQNIDNSIFENCFLDGFHVDGSQEITFDNCKVSGVFSADSEAEFNFDGCYTKKDDDFSLDLTNNMIPHVIKHTGDIEVINGVDSAIRKINMQSGNILVGASNTDGDIVLTGIGKLDKSTSGGSTIDESAWQQIPIQTNIKFQKGVAFPNFPIYMVDDQDHITGKTGLTVAGAINKDSEGSLSPLTNSVVEIGDGFYRVDLTAAEMTADVVNLRFTGSGADDRVISTPINE